MLRTSWPATRPASTWIDLLRGLARVSSRPDPGALPAIPTPPPEARCGEGVAREFAGGSAATRRCAQATPPEPCGAHRADPRAAVRRGSSHAAPGLANPIASAGWKRGQARACHRGGRAQPHPESREHCIGRRPAGCASRLSWVCSGAQPFVDRGCAADGAKVTCGPLARFISFSRRECCRSLLECSPAATVLIAGVKQSDIASARRK